MHHGTRFWGRMEPDLDLSKTAARHRATLAPGRRLVTPSERQCAMPCVVLSIGYYRGSPFTEDRRSAGCRPRSSITARGAMDKQYHHSCLSGGRKLALSCSRRGKPGRAPSAVHLHAATRAPSRSVASMPSPVASPKMREPTKASPAPVVSTTASCTCAEIQGQLCTLR